MKKQELTYQEFILSEEFFEVRLNTDNDSIDIFSLIKYLKEANSLIQGINETLNKDFNAGYYEINVEAYALEHGSIRVPLKFKKYAIPAIMGFSTTFLGGIAVELVSGNNAPIVIKTDAEEIEVSSDTFIENNKTRRSIGKIARMVVENDSITNLSLTYEKSDGQQEELTISKKSLRKVAEECEDVQDGIINLHPNCHLEIYGPILDNKPSSWRVKMNGRKIQAYMSDKDFLEEMTAKKIAFAPGDEIMADLEEIITEDEKGSHIKWYVRKVHSYPKYTRIIKNQKPPQLF